MDAAAVSNFAAHLATSALFRVDSGGTHIRQGLAVIPLRFDSDGLWSKCPATSQPADAEALS